jgi:alanine racemase
MMVDVTHIRGVKLGDIATLIGKNGRETLTAECLADWADTINYEVLSRLSQATPRLPVR